METVVKRNPKFYLPEKFRNIIVNFICYSFILLFLYTATSKLLDYSNSKLQMSESPIITDFASMLVWLIPSIEIIIAVSLFFSKTRLIGLYASLVLMVMFTIYIYSILNFSYYIPCSCGGVISKLSWNQHLVFNLVWILFAISGILLKSNQTIDGDEAS